MVRHAHRPAAPGSLKPCTRKAKSSISRQPDPELLRLAQVILSGAKDPKRLRRHTYVIPRAAYAARGDLRLLRRIKRNRFHNRCTLGFFGLLRSPQNDIVVLLPFTLSSHNSYTMKRKERRTYGTYSHLQQ